MKSYSGIIIKKELTDIIRDRRSIIMTLLLPLVLYPVMFWFIGSQTAEQINGPSETRIALQGDAAALQSLLSDPIFADASIAVKETNDALSALKAGDADIAVEVSASDSALPSFRLIYDPNKTSSSSALGHFEGLLNAYTQKVQAQTLAEMGIDLAALVPFSFVEVSLAVETGETESGAGMFLSMMLPMLLVMLLSVGGMATAVDLFAGEKERRTFEPLLCTGARRTDILTGKLGAVTIMSLLSAVASVAGLAFGYLLNPSAMTLGLDDAQGLAISPLVALFILLIVAAMAVFYSGLHILLSTYARSVKEASTYGSFVMLASYIPIFASMSKLGGDFEFWTAFVPVMNVTGCLKMVLAGITDVPYFAITFGETAVFVVVVLLLGRFMFKKENIMLRA